ncbi:hypothetical protein FRB93_003264 [Tulasnella sp. JGI-2019a]|nr:hypothetical protein FRB93_003264 [Tulasnella sp. JGI-2019a]
MGHATLKAGSAAWNEMALRDEHDGGPATPQASSSRAQSDADEKSTTVKAQLKRCQGPRPLQKVFMAASDMGDSTGVLSSDAGDDDNETEPAIAHGVPQPRPQPLDSSGEWL